MFAWLPLGVTHYKPDNVRQCDHLDELDCPDTPPLFRSPIRSRFKRRRRRHRLLSLLDSQLRLPSSPLQNGARLSFLGLRKLRPSSNPPPCCSFGCNIAKNGTDLARVVREAW